MVEKETSRDRDARCPFGSFDHGSNCGYHDTTARDRQCGSEQRDVNESSTGAHHEDCDERSIEVDHPAVEKAMDGIGSNGLLADPEARIRRLATADKQADEPSGMPLGEADHPKRGRLMKWEPISCTNE